MQGLIRTLSNIFVDSGSHLPPNCFLVNNTWWYDITPLLVRTYRSITQHLREVNNCRIDHLTLPGYPCITQALARLTGCSEFNQVVGSCFDFLRRIIRIGTGATLPIVAWFILLDWLLTRSLSSITFFLVVCVAWNIAKKSFMKVICGLWIK